MNIEAQARIRAREWYRKNKSRARKAQKRWAGLNRDAVRACQARYRKNNLDRVRKTARDWNRKNRTKIRLRVRKKYKESPEFRIVSVQRVRLRRALQGKQKLAPTLSLVGCSPIELKVHLERQFRPGMSWKNYGKVWQVDHKIPCRVFDLTSLEDQKRCFHFSNLQPLFSLENIYKGGRYLSCR